MSAERHEEGFKAVKFHCWCEPERDLPMCEAVHAHFEGTGLALMLDVEQRYDLPRRHPRRARASASSASAGSRRRCSTPTSTAIASSSARAPVPIIAAGNTWLDLQMLAQAIKLDCWSALRVDATICGGITPLRKIMALAEAHGMTVEIQCWGYTLTQAANLHVMLAYQQLHLFRAAVPYPAFEYGSHDVHPHRQRRLRPCAAGRRARHRARLEGDRSRLDPEIRSPLRLAMAGRLQASAR